MSKLQEPDTETLKEEIVTLAVAAFDPGQQYIGKMCQTIGYGVGQIVVRHETVLALNQAVLKYMKAAKLTEVELQLEKTTKSRKKA